MAQMNPQFGVPNFGIPSFQQMQAAFNSIEQQQKMWYNNQYQQFQIFCQTRGLNPQDQNSYKLFYQQMLSNMNNQQFHSPQIIPQPQTFIPQNPHGISPVQGRANNGNEPYIHGGDLHDLQPKQDKDVYINKNQSEMINIAFRAGSRYENIILSIPGNITIREMFRRYVEKLGISYNALQTNLQFLYNGKKMDPFSDKLVCNELKNGINITVFDQAEVIGAA